MYLLTSTLVVPFQCWSVIENNPASISDHWSVCHKYRVPASSNSVCTNWSIEAYQKSQSLKIRIWTLMCLNACQAFEACCLLPASWDLGLLPQLSFQYCWGTTVERFHTGYMCLQILKNVYILDMQCLHIYIFHLDTFFVFLDNLKEKNIHIFSVNPRPSLAKFESIHNCTNILFPWCSNFAERYLCFSQRCQTG